MGTWITLSIIVGVILTVIGGFTDIYDKVFPERLADSLTFCILINLVIFFVFVGLIPDLIVVSGKGEFGIYTMISLVAWPYLVMFISIFNEIIKL